MLFLEGCTTARRLCRKRRAVQFCCFFFLLIYAFSLPPPYPPPARPPWEACFNFNLCGSSAWIAFLFQVLEMRAWGGLVAKGKVSVWRKFTPFNFSLFQERSPWELTLEPSRPTQIPRGLGRKGTAFCLGLPRCLEAGLCF